MRPMLEAAIYGRVRCRSTTADLMQETWLRLSSVDSAHPVDNARAYVHRVAANVAIDHVRKESRRGVLNEEIRELLWEQSDALTPERIAVSRDALRGFRRVVAELPPQSRRIFFMNRFAGKSHRAIARELGVSETTVHFHIRRVLDRLAGVRDSLDDHD